MVSRIPSVLRWLFLLWLIAIGLRFAAVILQALRHPFNPGADQAWCATWLAVVLAAVLIHRLAGFRRTGFVTRIYVVAGTAAFAVVIVLSHNVIAFSVALWMTMLCAALGARVMETLIGEDVSVLDRISCGIPLGTGFLASVLFVMGLLHFFTLRAISVALIALTVVLIRSFLRSAASMWVQSRHYLEKIEHDVPEFGILLATFIFLVAANLIWAVVPEVQFDALNYHLAVPRAYLEHAGIFEIQFFHAYFARLIEMIFTACLALGGVGSAKLWIFMMTIVGSVCLFAVGEATFGARVSMWAVAFFLTTPLVSWVSTTAYVDIVVGLFVTSAVLAVLRWRECGSPGWLYVASFLCGATVGSKLTGALAVIPILAFVAFHLMFDLWRSRMRGLYVALYSAMAFILLAAPTYVLTYAFTGNPVFPLMNGFFKSTKWLLDNTLMNASSFGLGTSLSALLRFPFRLTLDTARFGEALPRGDLGLTLLLVFPFAVVLLRQKRSAVRFLLWVSACYLVLLFYEMQYARYTLTVLPIVSILAAATLFELTLPHLARVTSVWAIFVVCAQPLVTSLQFWNIHERFPVYAALGLESHDAFLNRAVPGYAAASLLNTMTAVGDKILGVDTENLRFYLRAQLSTPGLALKTNGLMNLNRSQSPKNIATELSALGYSYLFSTNAAINEKAFLYPYLMAGFLQRHTILLYKDDYASVYALRNE